MRELEEECRRAQKLSLSAGPERSQDLPLDNSDTRNDEAHQNSDQYASNEDCQARPSLPGENGSNQPQPVEADTSQLQRSHLVVQYQAK